MDASASAGDVGAGVSRKNAGCEGVEFTKAPPRPWTMAAGTDLHAVTRRRSQWGPFTPDRNSCRSWKPRSASRDLVHLPHGPLTAYYGERRCAGAGQRFIRRTFDETAPDYERLEQDARLWHRLLVPAPGAAARRAASGMQVVDVGMGTGLVSREILRITGEPQRLVGVDPSPGMMAQAQLPGAVRCLEGSAERMPLPDASADFIVMGYALRHIADLAAAFAEFRRVLKPGGRVLVLEISKPRGALGTLAAEGLHARHRAAARMSRFQQPGHTDVVALLLGHDRSLRIARSGDAHACRRRTCAKRIREVAARRVLRISRAPVASASAQALLLRAVFVCLAGEGIGVELFRRQPTLRGEIALRRFDHHRHAARVNLVRRQDRESRPSLHGARSRVVRSSRLRASARRAPARSSSSASTPPPACTSRAGTGRPCCGNPSTTSRDARCA